MSFYMPYFIYMPYFMWKALDISRNTLLTSKPSPNDLKK